MPIRRLGLLTLALLAMLAPLCTGVRAADDANTYNDPAMSFTPPAGFRRVPIPPHDPRTFEQKSVVAVYVKNPGTQDATAITLTMDNFEGTAAAFAMTSDNDTRSSADGAFIKRSDAKLSNGMPAVWEEVTVGSGFAQVSSFRYLWADGVRGVTLAETSRYGNVDDRHARADLANVSAVAYPRYRY
ncbi:MAG: hypothetical protein ABR508_10935 [Candidatus Baltobacteraceae bacterium]